VLGCSFLFPVFSNYGAVSVAICKISSIKVWHDLEKLVTGRSVSLKVVPFDRPHTTFYWSAVVTIALSCTIFELFGIEYFVTLKSELEVTQGH